MDTIRLDVLAAQQFAVPLEEAAGLIMAGRVYIGHVPADKPGQPVVPGTVLTLREKPRKYASRSGYKLEKALGVFGVDPAGKTACDIGASNGGFTDCLLQHGAAHVCSVDVAYGILAWELRQDERVTVLERTNARHLTADQTGGLCDLVTADVSFISLKKIFPAVNRILRPEGECLTLIKPQFEASPRQVGKNGVLRDPADLPPLLLSLLEAAEENGLHPAGLTVSPIHGTNGNVEYLAHFIRSAGGARPALAREAWPACIEAAVREQPDL